MGAVKLFAFMHVCVFSIIQTIHFLRFQICGKGKEIYIKTRWVKIRRKNDSKEKAKEIKRGKEKESVARELANFHICAVAINYEVKNKGSLICISLFVIFPSDYSREDNLRLERTNGSIPCYMFGSRIRDSVQRCLGITLLGTTFTSSQEEYLKKKERNNIFPHVNISTVNWS